MRNYDEDNKGRKTTNNLKLINDRDERIKKIQTNNTNYFLAQGNTRPKNIMNIRVRNKYTSNNKKEESNIDMKEQNLDMKFLMIIIYNYIKKY